ncbi:class I SAM-dependent methyltransferase [Amycolatopsis sp. K13G38]|uniref:Class I SAM-dependent methyltransferase n=1 Tax=Amycolatopsis acididurans TaxID=2724524 RepID=A0ABX1IZR0_9PSEU|nr:class I SAM-dependent methyltransferase [Amycolatopsis acididurans]NKQ53003.1 class I SAM-dependent methyltransferase [Amycolatopsis acididurans]
MLLPRGSEAISPTGHYTGYVWVRNGLAPQALATPEGRLFYHGLEPAMALSRLLGQPTFEGLLVARHQVLDGLLAAAIERGEIGQVIEIAAGLSARGWRFLRRYGDDLTYVEADLPGMVARKQRLLRRLDGPSPRVVAVDALRDEGPGSLAELAGTLDPDTGTAIVTEGLLNYFDKAAVESMWQRFASVLRSFPTGAYFADLILRPQGDSLAARLGTGLLSTVVRGRVHLHFGNAAEAEAALREAGFPAADVTQADAKPPSAKMVHIVDAWT